MESILSHEIKSGRKLWVFSQKKLADEVGIFRQKIANEKRLSIPSGKILVKIAKSKINDYPKKLLKIDLEIGTKN